MHKILEKLSNAVLMGGGLGLILPFTIYVSAQLFQNESQPCSQLELFHFFNTSVSVITMVEMENRSV